MLAESHVLHLRTFGFVVLRGAFDPVPLVDELDRAMGDGVWAPSEMIAGDVGVSFRYVPMMCERTPVSLSLLERFADLASTALGVRALPVRAKGVRYFGSAHWHRDSDQPVRSIGLACYLEPLEAVNGAFRVIPGSHRPELGDSVSALLEACPAGASASESNPSMPTLPPTLPDYPVSTNPGDVIVFDEHLFHASVGGSDRRQWRVDYVEDPIDADGETRVRSYLSGLYSPLWDGGYDVDRYPSYGAHWRAMDRPWVRRLDELGAYHAAQAEEDAARARRVTP